MKLAENRTHDWITEGSAQNDSIFAKCVYMLGGLN